LSGPADPQDFARRWIAAWNARDLEAVLAMFAEDAVFTSPLALRLQPEGGGVVRGKQALREYWQTALQHAPDLRFELTGLYAGVDSLLIGFRTRQGVDRFEVLRFRRGLVAEGHGTFPLAAS
jgi:ketosteroid isomerase-like protein